MKTKTAYIASFLALTSLAHGAITWNAAVNIANDNTQISTNGTSLYAYNFRDTGTSTVINGVTFTNRGSSGILMHEF